MRWLRNELLALTFCLVLVLVASWGMLRGERMVGFTAEQLPAGVGLYGAEPFRERAGHFRWTAGQAQLALPNPGGRSVVTLQLSGGTGEERLLQVRGAVNADLLLGAALRHYHLLAYAQPTEQLRISLAATPFQPPNDPRELGVVLGAVRLHGGGQAPAALQAGITLLTLALYGVLRTSMRPWFASGGAALLTITLLLGYTMRWPSLPFASVATLGGLVVAFTLLGYRVALVAWQRWREVGEAFPAKLHPILWVLLAIVYGGQGLWNQFVVHSGLALDLGIYLEAGRAILAGANPYATFGMEELIIGVSYVYPPASLPVFSALALLETSVAIRFWLVGNIVMYLIALLSLYAALPRQLPQGALWGLLGLGLAFAPFLENVAIGQINSLILLGMALFILGQRIRTYAWVGDLALALVILIKLTPGMLLLWPLVRGDWRRLVRVGLLLLLLCLPSLVLYGLTPWQQFATIAPQLLAGTPRNPYNQALVAQLVVLTAHGSTWETMALVVGRAFTLLLMASWLLVAWRRRTSTEDGVALAYGVTVVTLASSLIWYHHLMFLVIPLAWLGFAAPSRWMRWAALLAVGLMQITRLIEFGVGLPPWSAVVGYLLLLGALGFWQIQKPFPEGVP